MKLFALWGKFADSMEIQKYSFTTQAEADAFAYGASECFEWQNFGFFKTKAAAKDALEQAKEDQS